MSRLIVKGGTKIQGTANAQGSKNAVLPILACVLLTDRPVILKNCPRISDVHNMLKILGCLGCDYEFCGNEIYIDARGADCHVMPEALSKEIRSSIFMLGPILGRFHSARCVYPGGCEIGNRPIDLHLKGLEKLNVRVTEDDGIIDCDGRNLCSSDVHLDYPSVGATENIMMAAAGARGITRITNAAREPEIEDLENFMRALGINVYGAGTSTVTVDGRLPIDRDCIEYSIMPDRIVAGTLLCAAAVTAGDVEILNVRPEHTLSVIEKLKEAGCEIDVRENSMRLSAPDRLHEIKRIETLPHPGFPTDMQPQMSALCCAADGTSVIIENVFENRFKHLSELERMGADAKEINRTVIIRGVNRLHGSRVSAHDLRGGAALTIAGLQADGKTVIENAEYIDRGYEDIAGMLNNLGADITAEL